MLFFIHYSALVSELLMFRYIENRIVAYRIGCLNIDFSDISSRPIFVLGDRFYIPKQQYGTGNKE